MHNYRKKCKTNDEYKETPGIYLENGEEVKQTVSLVWFSFEHIHSSDLTRRTPDGDKERRRSVGCCHFLFGEFFYFRFDSADQVETMDKMRISHCI